MSYSYRLTNQAVSDLRKLPPQTRNRIFNKLHFFCLTNPFLHSVKLKDFTQPTFRFRVGDYRIFFRLLNPKTIKILKIGHRRDIYR